MTRGRTASWLCSLALLVASFSAVADELLQWNDVIAKSRTLTPAGKVYQNLCIGCDCFHEQVLGPVLEEARRQRRAKRVARESESAARRSQ